MNDPSSLSFAHHLIPLLSLPGAAGAADGKFHLSSVKAACKSAERIHGVLALAGRFELAIVPDTPDFFDPAMVNEKTRNLAWETIRQTPRLQWMIPTRRPDLIASSLPPTWIGKGFQNVCIGYFADSDADLAVNLQALRSAPVQRRFILLTSASPATDLQGHLDGIDWVIFAGHPDEDALAAKIGSSCDHAGVVFLFHQIHDLRENSPTIADIRDIPPWSIHPFGSKIDLARPTLPKLIAAHSAHPAAAIAPAPDEAGSSSPSSFAAISPDPNNGPMDASKPPSKMMDFVVVAMENRPSIPVSSATVPSKADHHDFTRLDGVIRRGLATFMEVGKALAEIRDRELWRTGGHTSWAEYCLAVGALTKVHANRLIRAADIAALLSEVEPIGFTPVSESQMRPLCRLQTPEQQARAWKRATERTKGQPTARQISEVVDELTSKETLTPKTSMSRKTKMIDLMSSLRSAVRDNCPAALLEGLISELEQCLSISAKKISRLK